MQKFNKHIVQKNETLKSVASLYNISEDALKSFHNNNCGVKEMILIEFTGQKELFLPRTAVTDKNRLVKFDHGNRLIFQPENSFYKYGVIINIENGNNKNELKYEATVRWLRSEKQLHFFEINRISNLYLNEEEVNEIADLLAYKTSKVLYPLQVSVDQQGKFNAVENLSVFNERWNDVKNELYKEFDGETVDEYCLKIEKTLSEGDSISLLLKNDYFLRTLFLGVYQSFGQNFTINGNESFPIVNNPVEPKYQIELEIDPLKDEYDLINIEGNGTLNEERSSYDFINGAPFSFIVEENPVMNKDGSFRIQYYLNGKTSFPESLYLECDIMLRERKKISVVVASIDEN
ncbi:hypothetical protein [Chryseobacterium sp. G0201]|uniref:hypothetical protein n=1 Tax=Chryseobacterium sp. G0201 TaxID=2487065 RepID=UPI000F4E951C|nr:hypothetical protein [Chryseobacterium sp. G0201]AZA51728.1 hypothetical protein EG348_01230 [Chryseobacterium sp. G0201]